MQHGMRLQVKVWVWVWILGMGMGTRRLVANFNKRLQMINVNKAQTQLRQFQCHSEKA